jgi:cytoskeletal protein RodZ
MSHDPTDATDVRAQALGCRVMLRKPILVRELIDAIMPMLPTPSPLHADRSTAPDQSQSPEAPRSINPTAAERRAARERARPAAPSLAKPAELSSDTPTNADPLGLSANSDDDLLLAGLPTTAYTEAAQPDKKESLGMQMRAQRIKRNIPLNQVDLAIGVHMAYLQAMEEDRFSHLPRGRMAEEMISKYAKYLNLDVAAALLQYRSFQYSEPVEPITDYGAANLVVVRYAGVIRAVLAVVMLGGLCYGLWVYEQQRIRTMYTSFVGSFGGASATPVIAPQTDATPIGAAQTQTASATPVPTTAVPTLTAVPSSTVVPAMTSTTSPTASAEASATALPATPSAKRRATETSKASATAKTTQTPTASATVPPATRKASASPTMSRTATPKKKP